MTNFAAFILGALSMFGVLVLIYHISKLRIAKNRMERDAKYEVTTERRVPPPPAEGRPNPASWAAP